MGWADRHIENLAAGQTVQFRPRGHSMRGRVNDNELCTVAPLAHDPREGDVVLCRVKGAQYLHLVKAVKSDGDNARFLIGNNLGRVNGWIGIGAIYGVLTHIVR